MSDINADRQTFDQPRVSAAVGARAKLHTSCSIRKGMVKLNASAGEILKRCDGERTLAEITTDLEQAFGATNLSADVTAFVLTHWSRDGWTFEPEHTDRRCCAPAGAAAVAAAGAHVPVSAPLRVLLQSYGLRTASSRNSQPKIGYGSCEKRAHWVPCSSGCRAASR